MKAGSQQKTFFIHNSLLLCYSDVKQYLYHNKMYEHLLLGTLAL